MFAIGADPGIMQGMKMATGLPGYLSVPEAAEAIGVTDSLVRRWVRNGTLQSVPVGKKIKLIPKKIVESFAKTKRKPGPKPAN